MVYFSDEHIIPNDRRELNHGSRRTKKCWLDKMFFFYGIIYVEFPGENDGQKGDRWAWGKIGQGENMSKIGKKQHGMKTRVG